MTCNSHCLPLPLVVVILAAVVPAQDPEHVTWLRDQTMPLATEAADDLADLERLAPAIGNARVVAIGEICHLDGGSFVVRSRLIRFLHERMGFDVLAWEGGLVDFRRVDDLVRSDAPWTAKRAMRYPCAESALVQPLFEYARVTWRTPRPLMMAGFDGEQPEHGADHLLDRLSGLLQSAPDLRPAAGDLERLQDFCRQAVHPLQPVAMADDERAARRALLQRLIDNAEQQRGQLTSCWPPRELAFTLQALRATIVFEQVYWLRHRIGLQHSSSERDLEAAYGCGNLRDAEMARLCIWLADEFYRGHKIIVAAASAHLVHNHGAIAEATGVRGMFDRRRMTTMGDLLHAHFGRDLYTILFTAWGGEVGCRFADDDAREDYLNPVPEAAAGSFEDLCHRTGHAQLFVDLARLPADHWLQRPLIARPLGFANNLAPWPQCADALLFIDRMTADRQLPP